MTCPVCKGKIRVTDVTHTSDNETYRQKRCVKCGHTFYTVEFEVEDDKTLRDILRKYARQYAYKKFR